MNLKEWREKRQAGEEARLPSGLEVRLRRVSVLDLAQGGRIPQTLAPKVSELMRNPDRSMGLEELSELSEIVDLVAASCVVEPAELDVAKELPWADRMAIYMWANEASGRLETFRGENGESLGTAFSVGELSPKAKRSTRP